MLCSQERYTEDDIKAVYVQNSLLGYRSVLESQFVYLPHDAVVPGALKAGDLCDIAAALAPRPLRIETPVNGLNRRVSAETLKKTYEPTVRGYAGSAKNLILLAEPKDDGAKWLIDALASQLPFPDDVSRVVSRNDNRGKSVTPAPKRNMEIANVPISLPPCCPEILALPALPALAFDC